MHSWILTGVRFGLGLGVLLAAIAAPQVASAQRLSLADINAKIACISTASDAGDVFFEGCNVHVRDGTGSTSGTPPHNGKGNLIVGYNEDLVFPTGKDRTGVHNLVVGPEHTFSSLGGLVAGLQNTVSGRHASVSGGFVNTASGFSASVNGGSYNTADLGNASVSGGWNNMATGFYASVSGGRFNMATGDFASVSGGASNEASDFAASVSGGRNNTAGGDYSTVSGENGNTTTTTDDHLP